MVKPRSPSHLSPADRLLRKPERIVGIGFRCSIACLRGCAVDEQQHACAVLRASVEIQLLPLTLIGAFSAWALAVESSAIRPVAVLPTDSLGFCRDECLAISLVAACQNNACPALRACAFALLGGGDVGRTLSATQAVADALREADTLLTPDAVAEVAGFLSATSAAGSSRRVH